MAAEQQGMTDEDTSQTTRVFVSGLPPKFTNDQLRSHFSEKFQLTDTHVIPDRRIGFVGFADHESAQKAAQYFNRSFIRMSRISVDLARSVEFKRDASGQAAPVPRRQQTVQHHNSKAVNPNLPETTNKRKRTQNDDGEDLRGLQQVSSPSHKDSRPRNKDTLEGDVQTNTDDIDVEGNEQLNHTLTKEAHMAESGNGASTSDADWLRGRTSRVLDLMGSEEIVADQQASSRPQAPISSSDNPQETSAISSQDDNLVTETSTDDPSKTDIPNARLFVRNLPFEVLENDIRKIFSAFGRISEVHLAKDARTSAGKGFAFVQFVEPADAQDALHNLDGKPFHGRLIHILPASDKQESKLSEFEISKLPLKKQKAIKRKAEATTSTFSWNSLYMNPDAVLASVADRLGVSKSDLLDASSSDAAVKQAQAETSVIQETKNFLRSNGVNVEAFETRARDDRSILLKNFPYGTTVEELESMLKSYGTIQKLIFPPTGTMAVAQFDESYSATQALKGLAYRNIKGSVLYLEKAPKGIFAGVPIAGGPLSEDNAEAQPDQAATADTSANAISTIFVRNLNFSTTSARLAEVFKPLSGFLSARVKTRTDAKRPTEILSMGFGFVEFRTKNQADAAVATMNGRRLDGHDVIVQPSHKALDAAEERRNEDNARKADAETTKIIIKNLPFEASRKDIRSLFGTYGQLRSVRMPKKFDSSGRGFAFADFVTAKEAKNAMEALSNTHLLGRRLVLDFAESDAVDPEDVIKAMEKKAGRQVHLGTINKMITGSARKKFNVDAREGEDLM